MCDKCHVLERNNAELRQRLEVARTAMQSFAYVISHDLGTPLRALTSFSDILKQKYDAALDEKGRSYLKLLSDGGMKAQAMLQGLLEYSRIYTQGHPQTETPLAEVVAKALAPYQAEIDNLSLRPKIGPLPVCLCDRPQIERLFSILIDNAMTYKLPNRPVELQISSKESETHWTIFVADNGIGIPPEAAARVFQIFKRLHTDEIYPGQGIGLALAARIVERHGGAISTYPAPRGGSVFEFSLSKDGTETRLIPLEGD